MDENLKENFKYKKAGNHHTIRIRAGVKSNNISPQPKDRPNSSVDKKQLIKADIGNLLKKIPRTIELQDNLLIQGCFSYVDQGFQKWKIGKTIGKGNSCVRKAMNVKTGVISAVKQIVFNNQQQEKWRLNQINILKKISHPNIVAYIQHYKIKNETWIFMEYIPRNLRVFYLDFGPPPTQVFMKFAKQIVQALAYLQRKNIIHKDIKCQNILLDNQGVLKLCDFGSSRNFSNTLSLKNYEKSDAVKSWKGTFVWSAPECLKGSVCLASDIWSLGCTFIELASGKLPWHQKDFDNEFQAIKFIVQEDQIPRIEQSWDPKIKQMILCCLKRDPAKRTTAIQLLERKDLWE